MKGSVCGLWLCFFILAQADAAAVAKILRSSNAAATERFMQGLVTYTSLAEFNAAAGDSEWCVDFEYFTTDDNEFRSQGVSVQDSTRAFTPILLQQVPTTSEASFNNLIAGLQTPKRAKVFVNNDGGGDSEVSVKMNINLPVVSWRATFFGIQDTDGFPSDGLKLTLVLQTSTTTVSINSIDNGFFGFTVAATEKVEVVRFEGDENVDGGETFEIDNICGSTIPLVPSEKPSAMPSLAPTQSPTKSPIPDPEPECFAKNIFIIGPIICFILDIFSFIF